MSLIIDGRTGEIIGTTERKAARQARPAFEGKTVKGQVVTTKVIPKPYITKVNRRQPPPAPSDFITTAQKIFLRYVHESMKGQSPLITMGEQMLKELEVRLGIRFPR